MFDVIVAEDELWIRSALTEMVEKAGEHFTVTGEASNGEDAFNQITEKWPHIIVTDIIMPKRDGLWLIKQIHDYKLPVVPVITSGFSEFQYAQEALRFGASEYLLKPISESQLRETLWRAADKFYYFRDIHPHSVRIQMFMDQLPHNEPSKLFQEMHEVLDRLLGLNGLHTPHRAGILRLWSGMWSELISGADGSMALPRLEFTSCESVKSHFNVLAESWLKKNKEVSSHVKSDIRRVCDYMQKNYMLNLTLNKMADMAYLSPSYFRYQIKLHTGQTFVNYLNEIRIENAKKLLLEADIKVYEVSELVGFSSLPYFNRTFKSIVGKTPVEYRKSMGII